MGVKSLEQSTLLATPFVGASLQKGGGLPRSHQGPRAPGRERQELLQRLSALLAMAYAPQMPLVNQAGDPSPAGGGWAQWELRKAELVGRSQDVVTDPKHQKHRLKSGIWFWTRKDSIVWSMKEPCFVIPSIEGWQ